MRSGHVRKVGEPADERLRVAGAHADVDAPEEPVSRDPLPGRRQARDARQRSSSPLRARRRVEADLADDGPRRVHERVELPAGAQRVHAHRVSGREDVLRQVHVPVVLARPADVLTRRHDLAGRDDGIDVPVAEVADAREAPPARRCREVHGPALDREHAMRAVRRMPGLGTVVPDGDVDAVVVDRAELRIRSRIEERAADRMLPVVRAHRPPAPGVVVPLDEVELPRNPLRHDRNMAPLGAGRRSRSRGRRDVACVP